MGGGVLLGMPGLWADDNCEPSDHYTSKVGGIPDWPFPLETLPERLLLCDACGIKLCLVAQVYAPVSDGSLKIDDRLLLVFGCTKPNCGSSSISYRALRIQRSSEERESPAGSQDESPLTAYCVSGSKSNWPEDPDDESDDNMDLDALANALSEAGSLASQSKKSFKNLKSQIVIKPSPVHARVVDMETPVLPCFYVYTQEEASSRDVPSLCSNYSALSIKIKGSDGGNHEKEEAWEEEAYEYDKALTADRTYLKFKKKLDGNPEQCFRYLYGGKPLLATAEVGEAGSCKLCDSPRHYEMQLMSPLIYFLQEAADDSQKHSLENWNWMTLIVHTCSMNCSNKLDGEESSADGWVVAEEGVIVQFEKLMQESTNLGFFS
ncbi:hypothetical protein K2173_020419 [Erythroxylum novogranatense]|uniref:Programmed cell death protein 2 C-terminal domain-containing protein n=1 Tax=Erythroxylum novogranatense TaxID=1862640 RepID=A0AAV8TIY5_9ROSI|nr:hypothetical protein K2173_020419 [Erythroxylum novogranatense]